MAYPKWLIVASKITQKLRDSIADLPDDELRHLAKTDEKASETNCGWATYHLREIVTDLAKCEQVHRSNQKKEAIPQ